MTVGKVRDLEPIYAALFALVQAGAPSWTGEDGATKTVQAYSRVPRDLSQIDASQLPSLFQEEKPFDIEPAVATIGGRYKYELDVDLVIVVANNGSVETLGAEENLPTRELNRAITAVLAAIAPPYPGAKQTLGNLVDSVYAKGKVERITGLPGDGMQLSVGIIPLKLLTI